MTEQPDEEHVSLAGLDPKEALRALLAVDPDDEPAEDDADDSDDESDGSGDHS